MIYLDNASTSNKKPWRVKKAFSNTIKHLSVNSSRGAYPLSIKANLKIYNARKTLSTFFNLNKPENVIFTSGCTESINFALMGSVKPGGHIILTTFEHNSVIRTITHLQTKYKITYTIVTPSNKNNIESIDIEKAITPKTYLVITNHTSNVTGSTANIEEIGKLCKSKNLIYMVDSAQSAGHIKIDMQKNNINLLCVAGHKGLYGPQGIGVLLINNTKLFPIKFGGTGTESENIHQPTEPPEAFESGTINLPGILALEQGVIYTQKHFKEINNKILYLSSYLLNNLTKLDKYIIYNQSISSGVISIKTKNNKNDELYDYLNKRNICTRNGLHCAPLVHNHLNTTNTGLIRISISHYNQKSDIKKLLSALKNFN